MIKFGDCTLVEFAALCDRRGIEGADHDNWIRLFKKCANAHGTPKADEMKATYRGIEYDTHQDKSDKPNEWRWAYYPKMEQAATGIIQRLKVAGLRGDWLLFIADPVPN